MLIGRKDQIAGLPMRVVRDMARNLVQAGCASDRWVGERCGATTPAVAQSVARALVDAGVLALDEECYPGIMPGIARRAKDLPDGNGHGPREPFVQVSLTAFGQRLAWATATGVTRTKAVQAARAMVATAKRINRDPRQLVIVTHLCLFGSVLGTAPKLGDLDVGLSLIDRWRDRGVQRAHEEQWHAAHPSRWSYNVCGPSVTPAHMARRALRGRGRFIRFYDTSEVRALGTPMQVLFDESRDLQR